MKLANGEIILEGVSKRFRKRTLKPRGYSSLKTSIVGKRRGAQPQRSFTALDTISVHIKPGASLGIIGRNGSGKSTFLKLVSGIYQPDSGRVSVKGRISALIELGAGFHPEFTGRENVYLGGVMYGLTRREIDSRLDSIVRYAELEQSIDDPVKTYSSGMYMRLGFSLAVHTNPDILLIDEVLAVGDAGFIHRCHETISDFRRQGKTMVFVTHDLQSVVRWCDEAIWLDGGSVRRRGEPRRVVDAYLQAVEEAEERTLAAENQQLDEQYSADDAPRAGIDSSDSEGSAGSDRASAEDDRWGNGDVQLVSVRMLAENGEPKWLFHSEESVVVEVEYEIRQPIDELVFGVGIVRADGLTVFGTNTDLEDLTAPLPADREFGALPLRGVYRFRVHRLGLIEGSYFLDVAAHRHDGTPYDYHHRRHKFSVRSSVQPLGVFLPQHSWDFAPGYAADKEQRLAGAKK
ncbi:MAG: ABC transporter ATP-binding protein [Bdellovibrionales bacterium]|nr:ABC transporter ATP-binding protein [Bdellovibrionales bacterium]